MKKTAWLISLMLLAAFLSGCASSGSVLRSGYYTAEAKNFDTYGWKEFVTIYVDSGRIVTVEYNAKNASGFIKSWDQEYMRTMNAVDGTYPNEYTRIYAAELLATQDANNIDAISGATNSCASFKTLAAAAIARSEAGDKGVAFVDLPNYVDAASQTGA